jgi:hypothetical protein
MGADQKNSTIMPMEKKSNGKKNGISDKDQSSSSPAASTECPGIGEATYREWFSKVH